MPDSRSESNCIAQSQVITTPSMNEWRRGAFDDTSRAQAQTANLASGSSQRRSTITQAHGPRDECVTMEKELPMGFGLIPGV